MARQMPALLSEVVLIKTTSWNRLVPLLQVPSLAHQLPALPACVLVLLLVASCSLALLRPASADANRASSYFSSASTSASFFSSSSSSSSLSLSSNHNSNRPELHHHHHHHRHSLRPPAAPSSPPPPPHKWPFVSSAAAEALWNLSSATAPAAAAASAQPTAAVQAVNHLHGRQHSGLLASANYEQTDNNDRRLSRSALADHDHRNDDDDDQSAAKKGSKEGGGGGGGGGGGSGSMCLQSSPDLVTFCGNDTENCFLNSAKCDGIIDCSSNAFDESIELCGCLETEFRCNSTCVDRSLILCNTVVDCEGALDEKNCETYVCPETHFKCNNYFCIPDDKVCNFVNDCGDNSDEEKCSHRDCWFSEFTCRSGQCIQAYGVCNGIKDCLDEATDEAQCHEQDFVHCKNGVSVHRSLWCDGRPEPDCPSQEDEQNCQCQANEFRCLNSRCIQKSSLCDAVCDCAGSCEDELNCTRQYSKVNGMINCSSENTVACKISEDGRTVERCLGKEYICDGVSDCPKSFDDEFGCSFGGYTEENCAQQKDFWCPIEKRCLPRLARCNFIQECLLGMDEVGCERPPCDGFQCSSGQCIDNELRCDSVAHCYDKTDEMKCENFQCPSGFRSCDSGQCIHNEFWCDGYFRDCPMGEDEENCSQPPKANCDAERGLFRCENGQCIDAQYRCLKSADRRLMCADGSNLHHCANWTCQGAEQIKCAGSYCVEEALRCNERLDCPVLSDWADEASCPFICSKTNRCPCVDTTINCTDQGLTAIPEGIEDQILRMILKGNRIGRNLTIDMFVRLDRMYMIDLSSNEIAYIPPKLFRKLWKLRILHLGKNRIDVIDSYTFVGMPNLVTLSLNGNKIAVIREHAFSGLASLKTLDLSNQRISSLQKNAFFGLRSLTNLVLSGNHIYELNDGMFSGLQAVISIDLLGNTISRVGSKTFLGLNSIKQITFDEFRFCCLVRHVDTCYPPPNEFSSCEDLMSNSILRICIWVLGLVSMVGNTFVISWRLKYQTVNRVHSFLIINLALGDSFMGVYLLIIAFVDSYYRGIYFIVDADWRQSSLCHFAGFLSTLSSEFSVFALLVITIDRLITITFPFRIYKMRMKDAQLIIAILWLVAIVLSGLPLVRYLPFDNFYGRSGVCLALHITNERPSGWEYSVFIFLVLNLLSFTLICGSYLWMFIAARNTQIAARSAENHLQNRMARRMAFIVLTDFWCWAPIILLGIVSLFGVPIPPGVFAWIAVFVLPLNSALNPVVYTMSGVTMVARKANSVVGGGGGGGGGGGTGGASPQSLIRMSIRGQNGHGSFKTSKTSYL